MSPLVETRCCMDGVRVPCSLPTLFPLWEGGSVKASDLIGATLILPVPSKEGDDASLRAIQEELRRAEEYMDAVCMDVNGDCGEDGHLYECPVSVAFAMWKSAVRQRRSL